MSKKKEQLLYDHDGRVDVEAIIDERIYNNAPPIKYTAPGRGEQQLACYAVASIRLKGVSSEQAASVMSVLIWLIKHANPTTGRCDPGLRKLAFETGLSEKTIRRALKIAEDIGYLTVEPRFGHTSAYHLDYRRMLADFHLIEEGAKRVSDSLRNSVEHHENLPRTRVSAPLDSAVRPTPVTAVHLKHKEESIKGKHIYNRHTPSERAPTVVNSKKEKEVLESQTSSPQVESQKARQKDVPRLQERLRYLRNRLEAVDADNPTRRKDIKAQIEQAEIELYEHLDKAEAS